MSTFRTQLITILIATAAAGLAEIILGLTQDCLNEILLALGGVNLLAAGLAAYSTLQQGEPGEEKPQPIE